MRNTLQTACLCLALTLAAGAGEGQAPTTAVPDAFVHPAPSPDGRTLLLSGPGDLGLYLLDFASGSLHRISGQASAGYAASCSPDGRRVGFKVFVESGEGRLLQVPAVYDLEAGAVRALHAPVPTAGVPSFSRDGKTAFTSGTRLHVVDERGTETVFDLGADANLAPISPDGTRAAFNDERDQIWLLDFATGQRRRLTDGTEGHFWPLWSPDGRRLALCTLSGGVAVVDAETGERRSLGRGSRPCWSPDGEGLAFYRLRGEPGEGGGGADLVHSSWDGGVQTVLTQGWGGAYADPAFAPDGRAVLFCETEKGALMKSRLARGAHPSAVRLEDPEAIALPARFETSGRVSLQTPEDAPAPEAVVSVPDVPYLHQVYDTPNWFNGHWACGATSAMMAVAHYEILPCWDCTVSVPTPHVSHYGNYVCEIYSYNGFTYDTASPDAGGTDAWGGYGYIVRDDWADTRGYMRDYFLNHGLGSSVDWSPTWEEAKAEINAGHPLVFLTDLTSAGHYVLGVGYYSTQHTVVFNDPYGDKDLGYMNWSGAGATYDWPGYNNGHSSLNTVWCYIYARSDVRACTSSGAFALASPGEGQHLPSTAATATLSWNASAFADSYDVYFGAAADPPFLANQTGTQRTVGVTPGATYRWLVKARVACRSTYACPAGPRSFTVQPRPPRVPYAVQPMTIETQDHGASAEVNWDALTCPSAGYHLLYGLGSGLSSWSVSGGECGLGPTGSYTWPGIPDPSSDPSRFLWFLVAGNDGMGTEGSWGRNSAGVERGSGPSGKCGVTARDVEAPCAE